MANKQKYQSEALGVLYEDALADYRIGAISKERLQEYAAACLVPEATPVTCSASDTSAYREVTPIFASGK